MKYILFGGAELYPFGGAEDFVGFFDDIQGGKDHFFANMKNIARGSDSGVWGQIVDAETMKIVLECRQRTDEDREYTGSPEWIDVESCA